MLRRVLAVCLAVLISLAVGLEAGAAAKKKKKAAPPAPAVVKPIYDAPMRVVIVQTSGKHCKEECPQWIAAEGEITAATPGQFAKVFKQLGKRKLPVLIRSPGGSISHAMEVGRMIRKRGLDVAVGFTLYESCAPDQQSCKLPEDQKGAYRGIALEYNAWCNSACHLVLAGGARRLAGLGTYVGVHKPRTVWTREIVTYRERYRIVKGKKKVIDRKIVSRKPAKSKVTFGLYKGLRRQVTGYYKEMGIDLGLVAENEKAEFQDINNLTKDQLDKYHLRTSAGGVAMLVGNEICKTTPKPGNCVKDAGGTEPGKQGQASVPATSNAFSDEPAMTFSLARFERHLCYGKCPVWIAAEGVISPDTPKAFRKFWERFKHYRMMVILNSKGGDWAAAQELAREFRRLKFDTAIAKTTTSRHERNWFRYEPNSAEAATLEMAATCKGACLAAFAGGLERHGSGQADVSVSGAQSIGSTVELVRLTNFLSEMGVSHRFMPTLHAMGESKSKVLNDAALLSFAFATDLRPLEDSLAVSNCVVEKFESGCMRTEYSGYVSPLGDRNKNMRFEYVMSTTRDCTTNCVGWIVARGRITKGSTELFMDLIQTIKRRPLAIMFDSAGGDLQESMKLGEAIRQANIDTMIGISSIAACNQNAAPCFPEVIPLGNREDVPVCQLECAVAFLGGKERILVGSQVIIFAGMQTPDRALEGEFDAGNVQAQYHAQMGQSKDLLQNLRNVYRGHPVTFDSNQATKLGIATRVVDSLTELLWPSSCSDGAHAKYCAAAR